jgi:hypothetical protein
MTALQLALRNVLLARPRTLGSMLVIVLLVSALDLFSGYQQDAMRQAEERAVFAERLGQLAIVPDRADGIFGAGEAARVRSIATGTQGVGLVLPDAVDNSRNIHRFAVYLLVPANLEACGNELRVRLRRAGLPVRLHRGPELSERYQDARRAWLFELGSVVAATLIVIMALFAGTASISRIERRREFAMLRALGLSQRSLFVHVIAEAVMISLSAVALGLLATSLIAWTARLAGWRVPVELNPAHQVGAIALLLAAVLAAVLVPALKAARDDITQGLAGGEQ